MSIITFSSGMFVSQMGKSIRTTAPLTEAKVYQAAQAASGAAVSSEHAVALVGGDYSSRLASGASGLKHHDHILAAVMRNAPGVKRSADEALGAGAMSGGLKARLSAYAAGQ